MIRLSRTVRTGTSLDKVWGLLSDFATTEQWDPGTISCVRTDSVPLGVGAHYRSVSQFRGSRTTLDYEVVTFEPTRRVVLRGQNSTVTSTYDLTFTGSDSGTEVGYQVTFVFKGAAKLAQPFVRRAVGRLADEAQGGMQRAVDAL